MQGRAHLLAELLVVLLLPPLLRVEDALLLPDEPQLDLVRVRVGVGVGVGVGVIALG